MCVDGEIYGRYEGCIDHRHDSVRFYDVQAITTDNGFSIVLPPTSNTAAKFHTWLSRNQQRYKNVTTRFREHECKKVKRSFGNTSIQERKNDRSRTRVRTQLQRYNDCTGEKQRMFQNEGGG